MLSKESDFDAAFAALAPKPGRRHSWVTNDAFFFDRLDQIVLRWQHIMPFPDYLRPARVTQPLAVSSAMDRHYVDAYRQAGIYARRTPKGEAGGPAGRAGHRDSSWC